MSDAPPEIRSWYAKIGRKGGTRSLATMTPEQRRARAVKAGRAAGKIHAEKKRIRSIFKALRKA